MNPQFVYNLLNFVRYEDLPSTDRRPMRKRGKLLHRFTLEELAIIYATFDLKVTEQGSTIRKAESWLKEKFPDIEKRYKKSTGGSARHRLYYHKWINGSFLNQDLPDCGKIMRNGQRLVQEAENAICKSGRGKK